MADGPAKNKAAREVDSLLASKRQQEIMKQLQKQGHVTTSELTEALQVSSVTIRRDLKLLEERGLLRRAYGGATLAGDEGPGFPGQEAFPMFIRERTYVEKAKIEHEAKLRIGQAAVDIVQDGETILLEAGTTVAAMLPGLRTKQNLTVVTNALNIAWDLVNRSNARVVYLGGHVRPSSYAAVGSLTEVALRDIAVQRLFLGADGIAAEAGVTTPSPDEAALARNMMARATETYVLADFTKFGRVALSRIGAVEEFTAIITDARLEKDVARAFWDVGVDLRLV